MAGPSEISHVGFRLAGDEDNLRSSHANVKSYDHYAADGSPIYGGVHDPRLGANEYGTRCPECGNTRDLCLGHRGHMNLRVGIPQPAAVSEIRRWLRAICLKCSSPLDDPAKFAHYPRNSRLSAAAAARSDTQRCSAKGCGAINPRIVKDDEDHFTFHIEAGATRKAARGQRTARSGATKIYPDAIKPIFERVTEETVKALGRHPKFGHPGKLILRIGQISPNTIRPSVRNFGGSGASYHDSTTLLQHLAKRNASLPDPLPAWLTTIGSPEPQDADIVRQVQNYLEIAYSLVVGSSSTNATQGSSGRRGHVIGSRATHSYLRNLPRKEGRLRANLLGARVRFISRSTISGNSRLRIDEVGIPLEFARTLQIEETVQEYNRDWLMTFFLNGRKQYPGCTYRVDRSTGKTHDVAGLRDATLEIGDVLFRDIVTGDLAYFNRQPTLERSSLGVHRVVVNQDPGIRTFQMNVLACELYNADFDGDAMNLWTPRRPAARAETILSRISNCFISTRTSGPVNGQVQDSVLGCYELTRHGVEIDRYHAMALFAAVRAETPDFSVYAPDYLFTGREIASLLLRQTPINYNRDPTSFSEVYAPYVAYHPSDTTTSIVGGQMVSGVLDKRAVGAAVTGSIFHLISREYGPQRALDAIFDVQQMALSLLLYRGFTVGPADIITTPEAAAQIRNLVAGVYLESEVVTRRLLRGEIVPPIGSTVRAFYERLQINALKVDEGQILRWVLGSISPATNGFFTMIRTGAKGSNPNLKAVAGVIGQTLINDERIAEQFSFRRTSPHHPRFGADPGAYGYVRNSYVSGMTAAEFVAQAMSGRFDLINKALSTAMSGFFMRKGVMNNQSSIVDNRRCLRKNTRIVQYLYGEDGLDARHLETVQYEPAFLSDAALRRAYWMASPGAQAQIDAAYEEVLRDRNSYRDIFTRVECANLNYPFATNIQVAVNVRSLVAGVLARQGGKSEGKDEGKSEAKSEAKGAEPGLGARIERVRDFCRRLPYIFLNETQERRGAPIPPHYAAATTLIAMLLRAHLAPPKLAELTGAQLGYVLDTVRLRYKSALIEYGTAGGVVAAQAIGQPLTQYMLDSHHRSVKGGTTKSGLVRVNEIYGAVLTEHESTSSMLAPLRPEALGPAAGAAAAAQKIASSVEHLTLRRFAAQWDLLLERYSLFSPGSTGAAASSGLYPEFASDVAWVAEYNRHHPLAPAPAALAPWCARYRLDKVALELMGVDLELIASRLRGAHPGLHLVHTQEAAATVVIRVWIRSAHFSTSSLEEATQFAQGLLDTSIRGIPGIVHATAEKVARHRLAVAGETVLAGGKGAAEVAAPDAPGTRPAEPGEMVRESLYAIRTEGTNLYGMLLRSRVVDTERLVSTSIGDTAEVYGIEAARGKIISETRTFLEDNTPNLRHLYVYADEMTRTGRVTSIERAGLGAREGDNIFLRMSYGDPVRVVSNAAITCAQSKIHGIAAPQLLGSTPQIGSLYNTLVVDEAFVRANHRTIDSVLDDL